MSDTKLREHLLELLNGGHAHLDFERAIADLPAELRGASRRGCRTRPGGCWSTCGSPSGTSSRFTVDPGPRLARVPRTATGPRATPRPTPPPGTAPWRRSGPTCRP